PGRAKSLLPFEHEQITIGSAAQHTSLRVDSDIKARPRLTTGGGGQTNICLFNLLFAKVKTVQIPILAASVCPSPSKAAIYENRPRYLPRIADLLVRSLHQILGMLGRFIRAITRNRAVV